MSIFEKLERMKKEAMVHQMIKYGGFKLIDNLRYLPEYKKSFYIMYEEDLSNMLSQTNTIITKN